MRIRGILIALLVIVSSGVSEAPASMSLKFDLESKIHEKLRSLLAPADPSAQIVVTVQLKKIDTVLPGTGARVEGLFSSNSADTLSVSDIRLVQVRVISGLKEFPPQLKATLEAGLDFPQELKQFSYESLDPKTQQLVAENDVIKSAGSAMARVAHEWERLLRYFYVASAGTLFLALGLFYLSGRRLRKIMELSAERLGSQLSNGAGAAFPERRTIEIPSTASQGDYSGVSGHLAPEDRADLQGLGRDSIVALLSDCYWCEEDAYAAWLWGNCSLSQRSEVLAAWRPADSYVRALARVEKRNEGFHHHPYYLKPLPVQDVSQEDLAKWVKKYSGAWHFLSPMRQAKLPVSLQEKMGLGGLKAVERVPALPESSRVLRDVKSPMEIGNISFEDELAIFENPASVPPAMRADIHSLVWLALLERSEREELLGQMTAQYLAEAWVGPDVILAKVEEALPVRKRELVRDYLKSVKPERHSAAMRLLVRGALQRSSYKETEAEQEVA